MYNKYFKRLLGLILSIVGLPVFGIIYIVVAPLIKMEDKGPVFYNAQRLGKNGKLYHMFKFRSMKVNAPDLRNTDGTTFNSENDPRVTKIGRILRKTSLDETPQLLNVLKGDMSLVGTRPPTESEFEQYNEHYRRRLSMTPGLTGLWQISGRSDIEDFDEVVRLDLQYIDNWSLTEDFKILLKTVGVVLFGRGAK